MEALRAGVNVDQPMTTESAATALLAVAQQGHERCVEHRRRRSGQPAERERRRHRQRATRARPMRPPMPRLVRTSTTLTHAAPRRLASLATLGTHAVQR